MVCYARPAGRMAAVVLVVLLVFGRHVGHFFDAAALTVALTVAATASATASKKCPTCRPNTRSTTSTTAAILPAGRA